jgi:2'-5' RNA ligase
MRVFIAVELPAAAVAAAVSAGQQLRDAIAAEAPRARLAWVPSERMHVTLRFVGDVAADVAAAIAGALAPPFRTPAFTLTVGAPGVFPARGVPQVCWVSITTGLESLRSLEAEISSRLERIAVARERRPFAPHVTLARVRDPAGLRGTSWLERASMPPNTGGVVDAITLFESRLSATGRVYTALQRTPLSQR